MSAVEIIDGEVRELLRRRGVDPMREPAAVRGLIDEVLADYADRAMSGALPVVADPAATARVVFDSVAGFGPLQRYLDDPSVEEIWINGPGRVFVARNGRSELTTAILAAGQVEDLVERMLKHTGRRVDLSTPFVDAVLPDGSRLHVAIPDVTREHWAVNIRKFVVHAHSLDELVTLGSLTPHAARFLEAAVAAGLNIIVAGGTQAGKTTLLNCLASAIPATERVVSCEEVFELKLGLPDWVAMQTRQPNLEGAGEIPLRRLVTEALRMRPSRIIVGEVRQAECLDLLIALNSGLPGMCSIHANSAREAITKLCTLPLLAGENVGSAFVVPTVAASVDLVVHIDTEADGQRRLREIVAVTGRAEGPVVETADVFATRAGRLVRADGYPPHVERFGRLGIDLPALLATPPAGSAPLNPVPALPAPASARPPVTVAVPGSGRGPGAPVESYGDAAPGGPYPGGPYGTAPDLGPYGPYGAAPSVGPHGVSANGAPYGAPAHRGGPYGGVYGDGMSGGNPSGGAAIGAAASRLTSASGFPSASDSGGTCGPGSPADRGRTADSGSTARPSDSEPDGPLASVEGAPTPPGRPDASSTPLPPLPRRAQRSGTGPARISADGPDLATLAAVEAGLRATAPSSLDGRTRPGPDPGGTSRAAGGPSSDLDPRGS